MERSTDRTLRLITVFDWVPAFAFLLPSGIAAARLFPVFAIAPMSFSAVFGLIHIAGRAKSRPFNILADLLLAVLLAATLIPGWIMLATSSHWRWNDTTGNVMLGTYGTVPVMLSFVIHAYFVLREIPFWWPSQGTKHCPHCHGDLRHSHRAPKAYAAIPAEYDDEPNSNDSKETIHPTQEQGVVRSSSSKDPRPSTDDESARLV